MPWGIISIVLQAACSALAKWAASAWERHESKVKTQDVADAPVTKSELEKTLEKGEL